VTRRRY